MTTVSLHGLFAFANPAQFLADYRSLSRDVQAQVLVQFLQLLPSHLIKRGISRVFVSLSHSGELAAAVAVLEGKKA